MRIRSIPAAGWCVLHAVEIIRRAAFTWWRHEVGILCACLALTLTAPASAQGAFVMTPIPDKPKAQDFKLPDASGKAHSLTDFRGKYVLVNFWATWCVPCLKEMPSLQREHELLQKEGLQVVAIHAGPGDEDVEHYIQDNKLSFMVLIDNDLSMGGWGVPGLPTTYLVDPEGRLVYRAVGERNWASPGMIGFLRGLLKPKKAQKT